MIFAHHFIAPLLYNKIMQNSLFPYLNHLNILILDKKIAISNITIYRGTEI